MDAMHSAFHKVCDVLKGMPEAREPTMEIIVVGKIVAHAIAGEDDADKLAEKVLAELASQR
jgi:hypothetical protein